MPDSTDSHRQPFDLEPRLRMIGIKIIPGAIGRAHRALVVLRVDQEKGGCRIRRDRRQGQIEPGAAVSDIKDLARDFGIGCLVRRAISKSRSARASVCEMSVPSGMFM